MSFLSLEQMPLSEVAERTARLRLHLNTLNPAASGILVFSRLALYHLAGAWVSGVLWVPMDGEAVLLCRKGIERAQLDSPMDQVRPDISTATSSPMGTPASCSSAGNWE